MPPTSQAEPQPVGAFWMLQLDAHLPEMPLPSVAAVFERVGPEASVLLAQAMSLMDAGPLVEGFARGRHCYIAHVAGILAAYGWVSFDEQEIGELGLRLRLMPGEAYIWDCATLPAYRGQRLYPALLGWMVRHLQSEGLRRLWIGADSDNVASQKGMARAGFQPIADIFLPDDSTTSRPWIRDRPGVPQLVAQDLHQMLPGLQRSQG